MTTKEPINLTEKEYLSISVGLSCIIDDIDKYNIDIETINKLRIKLQKLIK